MPESLLTDDELLAFNDVPSATGGSTVDPGQYYCKLIRYEKVEDGEWGPRRRWVFNLLDYKTRTPIYEASGELHEFKHTTSVKVGKKAKAREFFEALLGRELVDGEAGAVMAREALGKSAVALIGPNANNWIEIVRMTPLPKGNGKPAPKPVEPEPDMAEDPFAAA